MCTPLLPSNPLRSGNDIIDTKNHVSTFNGSFDCLDLDTDWLLDTELFHINQLASRTINAPIAIRNKSPNPSQRKITHTMKSEKLCVQVDQFIKESKQAVEIDTKYSNINNDESCDGSSGKVTQEEVAKSH